MVINQIEKSFSQALGEGSFMSGPAQMSNYLKEWRELYQGRALGLIKPRSTQEVAKALQVARSLELKIIPQGGGTGLVGGQIPQDSAKHVILSLERLNHIRTVDPQNNILVAEAGVVLEHIQEAAEAAERLFPLSFASQGSCQIGGAIATNAGGTAVLAYGNTRDLVLGLEVVLADGRIWDGLRALRKDNSGYDLKQVFIGAEGTLGIVTAAVLKLFPKPKGQQTAFISFSELSHVLDTFHSAHEQAGPFLTAFELIPKTGLDFVIKHAAQTRNPLQGQNEPWYALVEVSSTHSENHAESLMEEIFQSAFEKGYVCDGALATSQQQQADFWQLRHAMSEVQKHEGGSIKHDVSVPIAHVSRFIEKASNAVKKAIPGSRPVAFGHLGDGNIHFNVSQPVDMDKSAFLAKWDHINAIVHEIVIQLEGSIAAEHGIGRLKAKLMRNIKSEVELDLMLKLKNAFDPENVLNPGVLLPVEA